MKCSVEQCPNEGCDEPEGVKEFNLCASHWKRWGDFHIGYERGHWGDSERHGRLNRKRWRKAMLAFLDWCDTEIYACTRIAEAMVEVETKRRE